MTTIRHPAVNGGANWCRAYSASFRWFEACLTQWLRCTMAALIVEFEVLWLIANG